MSNIQVHYCEILQTTYMTVSGRSAGMLAPGSATQETELDYMLSSMADRYCTSLTYIKNSITDSLFDVKCLRYDMDKLYPHKNDLSFFLKEELLTVG